jgi:hypothetical protein
VTGVHIEGPTREGGGISPRWTTAARPSSAGYTRELEPGHSGRAKPAQFLFVVGSGANCLYRIGRTF